MPLLTDREDAPERGAPRVPRAARTVSNSERAVHEPRLPAGTAAPRPGALVQRVAAGGEVRAAEVMQLQRVVGNAAVGALLGGVLQRQGVPGTGAAEGVVQAVLDEEEEEEEVPAQLRQAGSALQRQEAAPPNRTGLPDALKQGVESLSGISLDDVRVHYNSSAPARVDALAYAQGTDIHVASGQERHLPHEAWHVVQQKQGRVQPTLDVGGVAVNDDAGLEREAEVMGRRAAS